MRHGLYIPPFDDLADPTLVARLCAEAEEAGWDGVFIWDQVRWREPVLGVADPQITLAAIASATERIRLGPMVTPLARRRPAKVARETATLDRLSDGRLTMGVGLGSDRFAQEYSITGEEVDDRRRARMLDEALEILQAAWSGELVQHRGEHYTVDAMRFLPRSRLTQGQLDPTRQRSPVSSVRVLRCRNSRIPSNAGIRQPRDYSMMPWRRAAATADALSLTPSLA